MAALLAGDRAGGQRTGRESAALLIRTREGWPIDIDLRVDHAADPVGELRQLFDMQMARQEVVQAKILAGQGNFAEAKSTLVAAVARGATWQRVWLDAAHVALSMEEPTLALQYLAVAFDQNPNWIPAELGEGKYAELGADPQFHIWITKQQQNAPAESHRLTKDATPQKRIELARRLLEIGRAANALAVLNALPQGTDESIESLLLASAALEALGKTSDAIVQCHAAAAKSPDNPLVLMRLARLERRVKAPN
jgi:thioredoxin-like negative regulator of GroEL